MFILQQTWFVFFPFKFPTSTLQACSTLALSWRPVTNRRCIHHFLHYFVRGSLFLSKLQRRQSFARFVGRLKTPSIERKGSRHREELRLSTEFTGLSRWLRQLHNDSSLIWVKLRSRPFGRSPWGGRHIDVLISPDTEEEVFVISTVYCGKKIKANKGLRRPIEFCWKWEKRAENRNILYDFHVSIAGYCNFIRVSYEEQLNKFIDSLYSCALSFVCVITIG